ncbi:MAG: CPBP family intramembrane metalloprotease [Bacteroidota bacterium]|nr:CPBP family intramembrane metalloprotease [Bacteroidota bacterium]MDP4213271.1 CPBP family intramembrane metalloprotease [Bacteroidota bacterium]MDP4250638.1 CPBP family intramembrane metalloprotease [Bacteroidota bacterium]
MTTTGTLRPRIHAGWLRVLIFCVAYLLLILAGVFVMSLIIHRVKGEAADADQLMKGELLWAVILAIFAGSLAIVYIFRRWVDRKPFLSLGLKYRKHGADAVAGVSLAVSMLGLATLILRATGHLKWTDIIFDGRTLFIALINLLFVAVYEEVVFRGYILGNLMESFNPWASLAISAGLFTVFHLANPGFDFFSVVNLFAFGLLLGMNYIYTRNLWFAISFHFAWNFLEGPVMGYPVSGIHFGTLLQTEMKGDDNITGGTFGLEGSFIVMAICILAILALYFILQRKFSQGPRLVRNL